MTLMSKLEEEFDISLETDDIVDFSSFKKGIEILKKYKITSKIINMHTIKPIDRDVILKNKNFKLHVCVEEHNTIGGLASAISEVKCQEGVFVKQVNLGVNDEYTKSGSYDYLLDHYNLSPEKIVQTIMKKLNND